MLKHDRADHTRVVVQVPRLPAMSRREVQETQIASDRFDHLQALCGSHAPLRRPLPRIRHVEL